ncbi:MAG TPA: hypothetical protein VK062_07665, partial [Burkholderiaceae bacterium]|nr:hypothetical protein [Burkholderiaceae bacterium]
DLQRHLLNGAVPEVVSPDDDDSASDPEMQPAMFEFGGNDDFQLQQAINHLEGRPVKRNDPQRVAHSDVAPDGSPAAAGAGSNDTAGSRSDGTAEKKSPLTGPLPTDGVERFRVTPEGLIRIDHE